MDKVKQYWMPVVAALCVIAGLSDFSPAAILLGAGFGYVWWKDVKKSSSADKKAITLKIIWWLLVGVGCDMLVNGDVTNGIILLVIVAVCGVFKRFRPSKSRGISKTSRKKTSSWSWDDYKSDDSLSPLEKKCERILQGIYSATAATNYWIRDVAEYASYYRHRITHVDVFPYKVARIRMTTETRSLQKDKWDMNKANSVRHVDPKTVDVWSVPEGKKHAGYAVEECTHCHSEGKTECPSCHGKDSQYECPDCHGKKGLEYECPNCHGKGESFCHTCSGKGIVQCEDCDGRGIVRCSACGGYGKVKEYNKYQKCYEYVTCPNCHGKRTDVCTRCNGTGENRCKECGGRGIAVCQQCKGTGKTFCSKCDSTGTAYCHTCHGTGKVDCQNCHGDGGFAYDLLVHTTRLKHECVKIWTECALPKALTPKLFIERFSGCKNIYHSSSEETSPDDKMICSEDALKFPMLKSVFDEVVKGIPSGPSTHIIKQETDIVDCEGIAKVEIQSLDENQYNDFAGKKIICWLNLATEELLDIWLQGERPDSWYEEHSLKESKGSLYWLVDDALDDVKRREMERGFEKLRTAYRLENPVAAWEYGTRLCEGNTPNKKADKTNGQSALREAENLGMRHSKHLDE